MLTALIVIWLGGLLSLPARPSPWIILLSGLPIVALVSARAARRAGRAWIDFVRDTADLHALGLVLLYALGVQFADAHGITTDGVTYFAQLRSLIFDRDLDVAAEFAYLGQPPRPNHVVPVGPLFIWLPLYASVAVVDGIGRLAGVWAAPAESAALGLGLPYVRAALVSSFAIGAAGLFALQIHLRHTFSRAVAFTTTLLVFGATPLYWYMVYEPSMTHAASFGFVALFVVCAARWLTTPDSRLPTPDSRLPTPDSRLPTPDSRLPTPDSPLPTPDSRLPTLADPCSSAPSSAWPSSRARRNRCSRCIPVCWC